MFGIKKLQKQMESFEEGLMQLVSYNHEKELQTSTRLKRIEESLAHQKLELSKINTKFHDLGEKISQINQNKVDCSEFGNTMNKILLEMEYRKETAKNLNTMLSEVGGKLDKIYEIANCYEELTNNMQHVLDEYLPIKKMPKLPKKIKATT